MIGISDGDRALQEESVWGDLYDAYLPKNAVVYDIGAFKGVTAIGFAKLGYVVEAFEGSPRNYNDLRENCKDYPNIYVHPYAVSDRNYNAVTRFNDCISSEYPEQEVSFVRLDDYAFMQNLPYPDLIKMDIEGMESVALHACRDIITDTQRPFWQLSMHEGHFGLSKDYPGWTGSFDFSIFQDFYRIYDRHMNEHDRLGGFNEYFLIPR